MKFYNSSVALFAEVVNSLNPRNLIGLDIRSKYVGVAVTDLNFDRAHSHGCWERKKNNIGEIALDLRRLVKKWSVGGLIVGHPNDKRMNNPDVTLVQTFVDDLKKTCKLKGVKYAYYDECCQTRNLDALLDHFPLEHSIAKVAGKDGAAEMLQDYLDDMSRCGYGPDHTKDAAWQDYLDDMSSCAYRDDQIED